jgi:small nuclear ribonucleoprotein D3
VYRGTLKEAEDTMNLFLDNVTVTARDGRVSKMEQVYVRGSQVRNRINPRLATTVCLNDNAAA